MGNHKAEPIMKIIDASSQLLAKWNELTMQMSTELIQEFYKGMGVNIPDVLDANVREINMRAAFATNTDLSSFTKGITSVVTDALSEDYPKMALDIINFASDFITQALGNGSIRVGVENNAFKSVVKNPENPNQEQTFITAIYAVTTECEASQWFTHSNFYASRFVFVVWNPKENELPLITLGLK